jgi:hypothetical protein
VGQSRELRSLARFALLDLEVARVHLYAVDYPRADTLAGLRAAGLPEDACHVRPPLKKVLRQAVRGHEDRRKRGR